MFILILVKGSLAGQMAASLTLLIDDLMVKFCLSLDFPVRQASILLSLSTAQVAISRVQKDLRQQI